MEVMRAAIYFHYKFSTKTKVGVDNMEQAIKQKLWKLSKKNLKAELKEWVPDSSYSRNKDTNIFKLIEFYL